MKNGRGGFVRQEDVDAAEPLARVDLDAQEVPALVVARQRRKPARPAAPPAAGTAGPRAARSYQVGANVPPSPATMTEPSFSGTPFGT